MQVRTVRPRSPTLFLSSGAPHDAQNLHLSLLARSQSFRPAVHFQHASMTSWRQLGLLQLTVFRSRGAQIWVQHVRHGHGSTGHGASRGFGEAQRCPGAPQVHAGLYPERRTIQALCRPFFAARSVRRTRWGYTACRSTLTSPIRYGEAQRRATAVLPTTSGCTTFSVGQPPSFYPPALSTCSAAKERYGWSRIGVGFGVRKVNLLILSDIITHKGKQDQH